MPKLTNARMAAPAARAMALRMARLHRARLGKAVPQQEMRRDQAEAGERHDPGLLEQAGVQAVVEMGDETEQAEDSERDEDPVPRGKAEQQDQRRRSQAGRLQGEQPEEDRGADGQGGDSPGAMSLLAQGERGGGPDQDCGRQAPAEEGAVEDEPARRFARPAEQPLRAEQAE